ncbi:NAD(P)H-dependent oxidoreductase [Mycolicibacterium sp. P9-64]|uniref:FMN-dependent NADH-azoreductase n=1 Tax=Mycolicibacterium sp. P9-64 TaxID=2024612 RepID=UPI00156753F6|nr:NAD(P)H-dependent oxidoreductase [Mycolicibacterium sp. P9-64]
MNDSTIARSSRVLLVTASPRSESHSVHLAETFLDAYCGALPEVTVDRLNTFTDLPAFGAHHVSAKMAVIARQPVPEDASRNWADVLAIADRVRAADTVVFAVPMWNGGIPWSLKLFIDVVTQPGVAFSFDPATGYTGLLGGRRAVVAYTSRVYAPGVPTPFGVDHQSTYFDWWLRYCGIDDVHELRLQPTFPGDDFDGEQARATVRARDLGLALAASTTAAHR